MRQCPSGHGSPGTKANVPPPHWCCQALKGNDITWCAQCVVIKVSLYGLFTCITRVFAFDYWLWGLGTPLLRTHNWS